MRDFWEKFFLFLEKHLPGWLVALATGYKLGAIEKKRLIRQNLELELEKEILENREKVRVDNAGKSSVDIVADAIRMGGADAKAEPTPKTEPKPKGKS